MSRPLRMLLEANIKNKSWNNYDLRSRSLKLPFGASRLASH
ncbi:hypothetical protein HanRHA438_Chr13g0619821 [Helianthus annuus]|nr:hypothetical protein HanRHA438_Chr13g0619821 [Helianthus annuus]